MSSKPVNSTLMIACFVVPISMLFVVIIVLITINSRISKIHQLKENFIENKFRQIEKNDSASRLEALTIQLGIDLVPQYIKGPHTSDEQRKKFQEISKALNLHVIEQLSKDDENIEPIQETVLSYYLTNQSKIKEIVGFLDSNPPPTWSVQSIDQINAMPSLLGLLNLQKLLVIHALYDFGINQYSETERTFNALLKLNHMLLNRPESLSQAIGLYGVRLELGLLRKGISSKRQFEVLKQNYRDPYFNSLEYEALHIALHVLRDQDYRKMFPGMYVKAIAGDSLETRLERIQILKSLQGCVDSPKKLDEISPAEWNFADGIETAPGIKDLEFWKRYTETLVHIDLTSTIINLRKYYNENHQWPTSLPTPTHPQCPNALWEYEITNGNVAMISIKNVPLPEKGLSALLSRKYRLSPN